LAGKILANQNYSSYKQPMKEFDIIIIGAGIAGASVAARLAANKRVLILDMEDRAGYHTTSRSAAMYEPNYGPKPFVALAHASSGFFRNPPQGFAEAPLITPRPSLFFMAQGQEKQAAYFLATATGTQEISETMARILYPVLKAGYSHRTFLDPQTADIDVDLLHRGFLRQVKERGGILALNAPVMSMERKSGTWIVQAGADKYSAAIIVNAAGAWGNRIAELAGAMNVGLIPKRRSIGVVPAPNQFDITHWPMVSDLGETWYAKPQSGKLLVSSADETPVDPHDAYADDLAIAEGIENLMTATTLNVERVEHSWGGLRSFVADRVAVVGFDPHAEGFFWLVGQGGYGIQTSPALSDAAAHLVLGKEIPAYIRDYGLDPKAIAPQRLR
jgi:D-arginine dehydrogenase